MKRLIFIPARAALVLLALTLVVIGGAGALGQGPASAPSSVLKGLLFDFPKLVKGNRTAVEKLFGKPVSVQKKFDHTNVVYKSGRFDSVEASYTPKNKLIYIELKYKPQDPKDWRAIIGQFGLSVKKGEELDPNHQYSPDQYRVLHLVELKNGEVRINTGFVPEGQIREFTLPKDKVGVILYSGI